MITDIRLQNFRSYADAAFEFSPAVNIIVGPNASGKTNLLEAILVVALGSSYRVRDADMVMFEKPWARLDTHAGSSSRVLKLMREPEIKKVYEIDGNIFRRLTTTHSLPVVLFEPNNLNLLVGSPEQRRAYLDDLLEQSIPGYGQVRRQYKRALQQRNALLKLGRAKTAELFPWNVRLSELAGKVARERLELTERINEAIGPLYQEISHTKTALTVSYDAEFPLPHYETRMMHQLESDQVADFARGFTGRGPHREDFMVRYDGRPAAEIASRGETRTAVLVLKIIELGFLETARDIAPLLLLDDVFSELDNSRRKLLTRYLERYQSFITTTDADIVVQNFTETCNIIPLG